MQMDARIISCGLPEPSARGATGLWSAAQQVRIARPDVVSSREGRACSKRTTSEDAAAFPKPGYEERTTRTDNWDGPRNALTICFGLEVPGSWRRRCSQC